MCLKGKGVDDQGPLTQSVECEIPKRCCTTVLSQSQAFKSLRGHVFLLLFSLLSAGLKPTEYTDKDQHADWENAGQVYGAVRQRSRTPAIRDPRSISVCKLYDGSVVDMAPVAQW